MARTRKTDTLGHRRARTVSDDGGGVAAMLRASGLRPTAQRQALARLLSRGGHRHVTAEQLHAEARAAGVKVSLATIYNTLHQFTGAGLLRELVVEAGHSVFDTNTDHHHHFYDQGSGALTDIPGDSVLVAQIPSPPPGCEIDRVDVIVRVQSGRAKAGRRRGADA